MIQEPQTPDTPSPPKRKPPRPDHCLNCGVPGNDNFCGNCGQENKDHTVALKPLAQDLLAEIVSWDSRLFRTVVPLLFRPGFLTNEYNAGRRVSYLSPLKLYLTISVLFFLTLGWKAPLSPRNVVIQPTGVAFRTGASSPPPSMSRTAAEYDARQRALPPSRRDPPLLATMIHHLFKARGSPQAFIAAVFGDIPKMMFLLLPLFALTLKLLYLRTKRLYVEHLVFLLHVHAFAFLALTPLLLAPPVWRVPFVALVLPIYVVAALRVVYKQGWPKTLVKFGLLGIGYLFLLALCFVGTTLVALLLL